MSDESEVEKFIPEKTTITLENGDKLTFTSKLSWGKEAKLGKLLSSFLQGSNLSEFSKLSETSLKDTTGLLQIFLPIFQNAPDTITEMVCIIINKDRKFVEEKLESEQIAEILLPFFLNSFKRYQQMYDNLSKKYQK